MRKRLVAAACALGLCKLAAAQGGIYTCVDEKGRRLTSDRPIAECLAKEQRMLNKDGSVRGVLAPSLTAEEAAAKEANERAQAQARAAQADAVRRDRNLLQRYPNEPSHAKARASALDGVRSAAKTGERRLAELQAARKPLLAEAEFYKGKPLPPKLKAALDANEVAAEAQRHAAANQEAELTRVNQLFENELQRLRALWAGAAPGTLGPLEAPPTAAGRPVVAASGAGAASAKR